MVYWQRFEASEWSIDYDADKLAAHGVSDWEAEEVIWNGFSARPDKKEHGPDRYQLTGRTDSGRALLLIVWVFSERKMRVLNGWPPMTDHNQQLTDEQRNELVIADVNDPAAWGDPIVVGPSKGPRRIQHAKHLELAAKFYVLSVLHRLDADANLTFSQSENVDITVVLESGRALTVDVKTITGPTEWRVSDFRAREGHFLAFVCYPTVADANTPPTVFIVASKELQRFLADRYDSREESLSLRRLDEEVHAREAWERLAISQAAAFR